MKGSQPMKSSNIKFSISKVVWIGESRTPSYTLSKIAWIGE